MEKLVFGLHVNSNINIEIIKRSLLFQLIKEEPTELFYITETGGYIFIANYGSVVFVDVDQGEQTLILRSIRDLLDIESTPHFESEKYTIEIDSKKQRRVLFNKVILTSYEVDKIYTIMFSIAQSIALSYYCSQSESLIEETRIYTTQLETKGKVDLKGRQLIQYIGKVLNLKNQIARNLYVFDTPQLMWEEQSLDELHTALTRELDITLRYRYIQENLGIIQENLELFKDLSQHSHNAQLEWIIIILILIEVVDLFVTKLLR
ncbi:RMD1 family protein [uncultured Desulfobacter sp.]|uniref:RMD1 family protein n=1 Tax=uncultured Desulfobacter sp. TaxID=240139 RepID=UPI002AAA7E5E|nr:RMD1 family protein [uncultured Desulfobacter sp.]